MRRMAGDPSQHRVQGIEAAQQVLVLGAPLDQLVDGHEAVLVRVDQLCVRERER